MQNRILFTQIPTDMRVFELFDPLVRHISKQNFQQIIRKTDWQRVRSREKVNERQTRQCFPFFSPLFPSVPTHLRDSKLSLPSKVSFQVAVHRIIQGGYFTVRGKKYIFLYSEVIRWTRGDTCRGFSDLKWNNEFDGQVSSLSVVSGKI